MKKTALRRTIYVLLSFILLLSLTAGNVFAEDIQTGQETENVVQTQAQELGAAPEQPQPVVFTVRFYSNENDAPEMVFHSVQVSQNTKMLQEQMPSGNPSQEGYTFAGWFFRDDNNTEIKWDPDAYTIQKDLKIYAKYDAIPAEPEEDPDQPDENPQEGADPQEGNDPPEDANPQEGADPQGGADPLEGADPQDGSNPEEISDAPEGTVPQGGADPQTGANSQESSGSPEGIAPQDGTAAAAEVSYPAFDQKQTVPVYENGRVVRNMVIQVKAPEGVFPEGALLKVDLVENKMADDAVEAKRPEDVNVAVSYTFDIRVVDTDGNEIEPKDEKSVRVSFQMAEVADENLQTSVYHISDDGNAQQLDVGTRGQEAIVETDGFSLYTVEFFYGELKYVLPGGTSVKVSEILDALGLAGTASDVVCSKPELFSASDETGEWVVTSHQAFDTEEWMRVTIDAVEYEIKVTDEEVVTTWQWLIDEINNARIDHPVEIKLGGYINNSSGSSPITIVNRQTITLDLNGHTIELADNTVGFEIQDGATLTLKANGTGGQITGGETAIEISPGGIFKMQNGTIFNSKTGVNVSSSDTLGGIFKMNGGTISGNTTGVSISSKGLFVMYGGSIINNNTGVETPRYDATVFSIGDWSSTGPFTGQIINNSDANVKLYKDGVININWSIAEESKIGITKLDNNGKPISGSFTGTIDQSKLTVPLTVFSSDNPDFWIGWDDELKKYIQLHPLYSVTFVDDDGTVLKEAVKYKEGTPADDIVKPDDPKKPATAQYTYTFKGWDPEIEEVTKDAIYKATYTATVNEYNITFNNEDGSFLYSSSVAYGKDPVYGGKTRPTKAEDEDYTYTWSGWTDGEKTWSVQDKLPTVTGNATYKATFTANKKIKYSCTSGTGQEYKQGASGTLTFVFKRSENDEETFSHFKGLKYDGKSLTADKHYTAKSGSVIVELKNSFLKNQAVGQHTLTARFDDGKDVDVAFTVLKATTYTVTFNANGRGTAPAAQTVLENAKVKKPASPTAQGYKFGGWYTETACVNAFDFSTPITGNITLYAKWTKSSSGGGSGGGSGGRSIPGTGDPNSTMLWIVLAAASFLAICGAVYLYRRRRSHR